MVRFSSFTNSLIIGCFILLLFGAWDDARNIRPRYKFIGQLLAAIIVVYYGDIYVSHFPFWEQMNFHLILVSRSRLLQL